MKRMLTMLIAVVGLVTGVFAEKANVTCQLGRSVTMLSLGAPVSYACDVTAESGVKSVKLTGLPNGLKYDKKTSRIVGTPTKSGTFTYSITVVSKAKMKGTMTMGTVKVPEFSNIVVGNYKGGMTLGGKLGQLTMKFSNKGKTTGKLVFGNKKSLAIKSGWFTSAELTKADFLLTFKDGSTMTMKFSSTHSFNGVPLGSFTKNSGETAFAVQDVFTDSRTKAAAKKLFGKKKVLKLGDLTLTLNPNGSATAKGVLHGEKINYKTNLYWSGLRNNREGFICFVVTPNNYGMRVDFTVDRNGNWSYLVY